MLIIRSLHPDDKIPVSYAAMPHAIFSSPQISGVGFTEQELKEEKKNRLSQVYLSIHRDSNGTSA